ncbi:MAG: HAD family hydrolase, partial [Salinarimonas sp.]
RDGRAARQDPLLRHRGLAGPLGRCRRRRQRARLPNTQQAAQIRRGTRTMTTRDTPGWAFFDVDDTLIRIKSMFDFFRYWSRVQRGDEALLARFEADFARMRGAGVPRTDLNRAYYQYFAGVRPDELEAAGTNWAAMRLAGADRLFLPESCRLLDQLRTSGKAPVFVSGSFAAILEPIAARLGVAHILATTMLVGPDGRLTGGIGVPQTIGAGKADAIALFLRRTGVDPAVCVAVGDDMSDLPMLEAVGSGIAVGEGTALAAHARARDWPVLPGCEAAA